MNDDSPQRPMPASAGAWLEEIVAAYLDATEAMPFGPLVGRDITEAELFHLGPSVCLKFRGIEPSAVNLRRATDAALSSYVATTSLEGNLLAVPQVAFAFCYVASHFGLDLIDESTAVELLDYLAGQVETLVARTERPTST